MAAPAEQVPPRTKTMEEAEDDFGYHPKGTTHATLEEVRLQYLYGAQLCRSGAVVKQELLAHSFDPTCR